MQLIRHSLHKLARIARPQIALQAAIYTCLGAYLSAGVSFYSFERVPLAAIVVAVIVAFGFVINDVADLELDRLAKPGHPLPAGELTQREAHGVAWALAAFAVVLALPLPPLMFTIALCNLVLTAAYALFLKRTVLLGNLTIALLNSSILPFGALASAGVTLLLWSVATMSFLYTLAQEVLYTVRDVEGDSAAGLVTAPVYFGVEPSLWLARVLLALAVLAAITPYWIAPVATLYFVLLGICTIVPVVFYVMPLMAQTSPERIGRACKAVKIIRLSSLIPLILLPAG